MGHFIYYFAFHDTNKTITVFAPSNTAMEGFRDDDKSYWEASTERMQYLLR